MAPTARDLHPHLRGAASALGISQGDPDTESGENVSTSEAAKQLLESAREDRLEVAELLADATVALAATRRKAEAGQSLSRAEWIVLAYYVQLGVESHVGVRFRGRQ